MFGPRSWRTNRAYNLGPNMFPSGPTQTQSIRRVYTTEEKWHGSDKKWNGSIYFCKETVNVYPFRYGTIGAYGPLA